MAIEEYLAAQGVWSTDNPGSSEFSLDVTSSEQFQDTEVISSEKAVVTSSVIWLMALTFIPIKTVSRIVVKVHNFDCFCRFEN